MPVMMVMRWPGVSKDQYEKVRKATNFEGEFPQGAMFHVVSFGDGAMHVTDIWESEADFQRFMDERLGGAVADAGITTQPESAFYPMHNCFNPRVGMS